MDTHPRDIDQLRAIAHGGARLKYVYFWGHRDGVIDAGCLSQWLAAEFTVDEISFRTAEHYMMWRKAMLFGDTDIAARILDSGHPKQAKDLGRQVRHFDQGTWRRHRFGIVVDGNLAKFGQHPELSDFLTGTGNRILVEASPMDRVWGIGLAADDPRAARPDAWRGDNLLGFALMDVRAALAEVTSATDAP